MPSCTISQKLFYLLVFRRLSLYIFPYIVSTTLQRREHGGSLTSFGRPSFQSEMWKGGKNLSLPNGIPLVLGSHLKIFLGDNVIIGRSTIGASKLFDEPVLRVGSNTSLGYGTVISVAKEVSIGDNCLIASHCMIMDSDDHPIDPQKRFLKMSVERKMSAPLRLETTFGSGLIVQF